MEVEFVIEKNVPLRPRSNIINKIKYPFGQMEVGDSFAFDKKLGSKVWNSAYSYGKYHNKKFVARFDGDICRIFRVE